METPLLPPSAHLPTIKHISKYSIESLAGLVEYLHGVYNPPIRGTSRTAGRVIAGTGRTNLDKEKGALEELRADSFERTYALRWLTALVSQTSLFQDAAIDTVEHPTSPGGKVDALIQSASALIAICAGTATTTLTRTFLFYSPLLTADVEIRLTDTPITVGDGEIPTVGTQTWGSARLLAEMLVANPAQFGLSEDALRGEKDIRVLELGAGTGLVSLALAQLISSLATKANADVPTSSSGGALVAQKQGKVSVVASDYDPSVLKNLHHNIRKNFPDDAPRPPTVHTLDWSHYAASGGATLSGSVPPFDEHFDVILGADVVYEPAHALWVRDCVMALLRRSPSSVIHPRFHMVMPLRGTHAFESRAVEELFALVSPLSSCDDAPWPRYTSPDSKLRVIGKETLVCEEDGGRLQREMEYVHYVIGWSS